MRRTARRKKGGRVIAQGKTAKIIDPAIPCKDKRYKMEKYISRVTKYKRMLISSNTHAMEALKKIDPDQKYFIYPKYCESGDLLPENIEDGITEENKHISEILYKGNISWYDYVLTNKPTEKQLNHLLKAIKLLHSNGIVHGDLHRGNIILMDDNLPRLIDFDGTLVNAPKSLIKLEKELVNSIYPSFKLKTYELYLKIYREARAN
jgi:serine/threonine protein kinase